MKHRRLALLSQYFRFNLKAAMEYRAAFLIQVFGMMLNNASFIIFWAVVYSKTGEIKGYGFENTMFLWALVSLGFGITEILMGNWMHIDSIIFNGELDVYLLQPRNIPLNILTSRMHVSGWGDIVFGLGLFAATQTINLKMIGLFLIFSVLAALLLAAVNLAYQSLAFFVGRADTAARLGFEAMLTFSTYPGSLFQGPIKLLLMTGLPVFWMAYLPAELMMDFHWAKLGLLIGADLLVIGACVGFFYLGLRRYESGNRMGTRL